MTRRIQRLGQALARLTAVGWLISAPAASGLAGCKGCSNDEAAVPAVRESKVTPVDNEHVALLDRRAKLRIDSAKPMAKDAAGVTQCGGDLDCFVLTAERCEPAVLDHTQVLNLLGIEQTLVARYAIVGPGEAGCEVHREIKTLELQLVPELIVALKTQGRSEEELAKIRDDALAKMKERNPAQVSCHFSSDEMLEVALDLVDKKLESKPWHKSCKAKPVEEAPAEAPAEAKDAPAAAKEAAKEQPGAASPKATAAPAKSAEAAR